MRILYYFSFLIATTIAFSSCQTCIEGHGEIINEVRDLESFQKLDVSVPADVVIHIGEFPKISISTHENLMENISTEVKGKTLVIKSKPCISSATTLQIDLVVTKLNSISINGSAAVKIKEQLQSDDFKMEINGSGMLIANIFANSVSSEIDGSGQIMATGTTKDMSIEINGSGVFKGLGLLAYKADVEINGSGEVSLHAKNQLNIEINGSGDVGYSGSPKIKSDINGSGEVKKVD